MTWISCSRWSICMSVHSQAAKDGCGRNMKWVPSEIQSICVRTLYGMMCFARESERKDRGGEKRQTRKRRKESRESLWSVRALAYAMTLWLFVDTFWTEALEHKKGGMKKKRKRNALVFDGWRGLLLHLDGVQLWQAAKYTQTSCLASERCNRAA